MNQKRDEITAPMRLWAKRRFDELWDGDSHPSHAAAQALEDTADHFNLSYEVEGFCSGNGNSGVTYLNTGNSYDTTIYVLTTRWTARVCRGCIADRYGYVG